MEVIYGLVGVSVVLVIVIAAALLWAVRSGQFEDLEGPAWRVLMDDDRPRRDQQPRADRDPSPGPDADGRSRNRPDHRQGPEETER
jgi:cbb3-type cytochrome oxidase maturation protein